MRRFTQEALFKEISYALHFNIVSQKLRYPLSDNGWLLIQMDKSIKNEKHNAAI